ncbi:MAG: DUF2723 domain-containing protein [Candidatus Latescibacteria bacterium]|nr:DUF2723 domain-containing protein [Candidatus Latescibacterota bacterium]
MTTRKINTIIAVSIFFITFIIFLMTVAPTISFWDCGEFITCSYIMGIPHPPGSPFLSLIGRVMTLIPFYDFRGNGISEIAYRVNMIGVILGALTAMLTYLIMTKLIRKLRPPTDSRLEQAITMFCAAITAFMVAFSDEFWTNAVETETYMPSLFMSMIALWLTLRWEERKDDPSAVRYLFCAAYIIGLGNGVHLSVLLIAPTVFFIVFFAKPEWFLHAKLWLYLGIIMVAAVFIKWYAGLGVQYLLMASFAFLAPFILYRMYRTGSEVWKITLLGMILCGSLYIIGFSVYPTVMVRAAKKPAINENNPDNWKRYKLYMSRDQYGQGNMYTGMFTRNASASFQFGFMYLRYLIQQFPIWGPTVEVTFTNDRSPDSPQPTNIVKTVYLSVLLLSVLLYGLYTHGREDWRSFVALLLFFTASSIGLALYLNMQNPQVRERPYFFLGSYYIIMYWIGMGIWGLITDINDWLKSKNKSRLLLPATVSLFIIFGTLPPGTVFSHHLDPDFNNYQAHDRTYDWIAWDYGYNILASCEPNAILFSNGDNDTFPIWYLQEVSGIRKDVRLVNLSLLNTDWYILQLKYETAPILKRHTRDGLTQSGATLPIEYTDDFIENTLCGREEKDLAMRLWPEEGQDVSIAGIKWKVPAQVFSLGSGETLGMLRVQDIMVFKTVEWVNWERPVYFAVTVALENKIGLSDYLAMEGMVYRLMPEKALTPEQHVNLPVMHENVFEKYQYRYLDDPTIYLPPNSIKLVTNYFIGFAQLCELYTLSGDRENTIRSAWGALKKTPNDFDKRIILYQILAQSKINDVLYEFLEWEMTSREYKNDIYNRIFIYQHLAAINKNEKLNTLLEDEWEKLHDFQSQLEFGTLLIRDELDTQAKRFLEELIEKNPGNIDVLKPYSAALYSIGEYSQSLEVVNRILQLAPGDKDAIETREILNQILESIVPDTTQN